MGLELTPDTGAAANFKVYKLLCVGAAGSRVFTVREEWNSANPIPISGGGTGATTAAGALVNLGLGEGSLIPIGVPLPYPLATAPTGYLKCNGSSFSTTTYPQLAVAYPSGVLPDLRGEFIRGWDDGRRVDSGRVVLTGQSQSVQKHTHGLAMAYSSESGYKDRLGASPNTDMIPIKDMTNVTTFTGSGEYYLKANDSTGVETRPRNVAFNYIVRAL
ncbi:TPA: tail fiber protein [Yersinia enterocolitica]|nr:tail fiber protein [Yersinia enterocolitica]HDV0802818.1 tail fiber protein [Yersinia enterocolitica]HDZ9667456.1 tail fiber protein [Yersinia enterocolitica]